MFFYSEISKNPLPYCMQPWLYKKPYWIMFVTTQYIITMLNFVKSFSIVMYINLLNTGPRVYSGWGQWEMYVIAKSNRL